MHSVLGQSFVLLGLVAAAFGAVIALVSGRRQSEAGMALARQAAYLFSAAMLAANIVMVRALLLHDFSVGYVAQVGSLASPTWVTVVSLWSSLEGSILFWGLILGLYVTAFTISMAGRYREYVPYATGTILVVCTFFAFLIAGPADPFLPVSPVPTDGPGPNPLLQNHFLMVVHPPLLYLGYVGMTIPFGIAVAALLRGELAPGWLKPLRRWTLIPWAFLTCGIIVGGWWAYEVLGWGGYWAWDPVENASFLPWLAATGYLHSTVVQERKRMFKAWTLTMVLGAFLLTILGTFMTRSGVFNSVHSFTQSAIGPIFLGFLTVTLIFSIVLLSLRAHLLEDEGQFESMVSRESAFLLNNILFVTFTFTVLLGTVFPLITEAVKDVKISVGEPYFDQMAGPIGLLLVFLMGVGPVLPWGRANRGQVVRLFATPLLAGVALAAVCFAFGYDGWKALLAFGLCGFAAFVTLREMVTPVLKRMRERRESFTGAFGAVVAGGRRRFGGYTVHLAVIAIVAAIAGSKSYKQSVEASLLPGESFELGEYAFTYIRTEAKEESNRTVIQINLEGFHRGDTIGEFRPGLNYYRTQREPIGTPHVRTVGNTDVYLSMLSFRESDDRVVVKAYLLPLVPWIWWSIPLIALGSMVALWPRRRRGNAISESPQGAT